MFRGLYTAIITPFNVDKSIDYKSLYKIIDKQINIGVQGIVILGTTGESPTITISEEKELITKVCTYVSNKTNIIIGTGSNCTQTAINKSKFAEKAGADGLLVVNPYYNKPSQEGMYEHFTSIANSVHTPIILYNIASRTGVNLEIDTIIRLANHSNIVAIKEASGDMKQIKKIIQSTPKDFHTLSGDDALTLELCSEGGHGVISVLSNILPNEMLHYTTSCLNQNWNEAKEIHQNLIKLFDALFLETNPQPIKTLMSVEGLCQEIWRLPLCKMSEPNKQKLLRTWNEWNPNTPNL